MYCMEKLDSEAKLEQLLARPAEGLTEMMKRLDGDIIILGIAGKMGVSMGMQAVEAIRLAGVDKKVYGVSRFSKPEERAKLEAGGIITIACDLQDPAQVATAVLETSGAVSVFPKADSRPVSPADLGIEVPAEGLPLPLVLDGHVNRANLQRGGLTESWLQKSLHALGYGTPRQVLFCCLNTQGQMMVQGKGKEQMQFLQALEEGKAGW